MGKGTGMNKEPKKRREERERKKKEERERAKREMKKSKNRDHPPLTMQPWANQGLNPMGGGCGLECTMLAMLHLVLRFA